MTKKLLSNGLFLCFAILLLWGLWAFLPKLALQSINPQTLLFFGALGGLFVAVPVFVLLKGKVSVDKKSIAIVAAGGFFNSFAMLMFYYALRSGSVGAVTALTAMYPVVTLILAAMFFSEKINWVQGVAVILAMISIWLLVV